MARGDLVKRLVEAVAAVVSPYGRGDLDSEAEATARSVLAAVLPMLADEIDASPDEKHPRWVARRNLATDLRDLAEQVSA